MNDFKMSYEAWATRAPKLGKKLTVEEKSHLARLKEACESVWKLGWWNEHPVVGNNPRGPHYGVHFGFKVRDANLNEPELTRKIQEIVVNCGFQFKRRELTTLG